MTDRIYKITTAALWAEGESSGTLPPSPLDVADGFMHFSAADQLAETLRLHFKGQSGLVLAEISTEPLGDALKWEPSRGGALFPHLYAPLKMDAITRHWPVAVDDLGETALPDDLG